MRRFLVSVLTVTLSASGSLAATSPSLAPGKPAGVHQAQLEGGTGMIVVAGVALIGIGIALATAGNGSSSPNTNPVNAPPNTAP